MRQPLLKWGIMISALLYLACLAYPAISLREIYGKSFPHLGFDVALIGFFAVLSGNFAWLANIFLLLSWMVIFKANCLRKDIRQSLYLSLIALGLSLHTLQFNSIGMRDKSGSCCLIIDGFYIGFYLWIASIIVVVVTMAASLAFTSLTPQSSGTLR